MLFFLSSSLCLCLTLSLSSSFNRSSLALSHLSLSLSLHCLPHAVTNAQAHTHTRCLARVGLGAQLAKRAEELAAMAGEERPVGEVRVLHEWDWSFWFFFFFFLLRIHQVLFSLSLFRSFHPPSLSYPPLFPPSLPPSLLSFVSPAHSGRTGSWARARWRCRCAS